MALTKELPKIAAEVLHNTHCTPKGLKFKFELIAKAYGEPAVMEDFEKWCREVSSMFDNLPRYPITDYLKVIDQRLGNLAPKEELDTKDPQVREIREFTWALTGFMPIAKHVAELLKEFKSEEITGALQEYNATLDDKEVKAGMKSFFGDGGAAVVILSRRRK